MKTAPNDKLINNPIILALDVDTESEALRWTEELGEIVGAVKLGPRLCVRYGQNLIRQIAKQVPVFVDNKYFDIPSTTAAAVQASFEAGATLVTVHALNGPETLRDLTELEKKLNQERPFKILCVTILTSFERAHLSKSFKNENLDWHVKTLSEEVKASGLTGLVCAAQDIPNLAATDFYLVTPGIRLATDPKDDQKRIMAPAEALKAGAKALVVGRPILQAPNPKEAAMDFAIACLDRN